LSNQIEIVISTNQLENVKYCVRQERSYKLSLVRLETHDIILTYTGCYLHVIVFGSPSKLINVYSFQTKVLFANFTQVVAISMSDL